MRSSCSAASRPGRTPAARSRSTASGAGGGRDASGRAARPRRRAAAAGIIRLVEQNDPARGRAGQHRARLRSARLHPDRRRRRRAAAGARSAARWAAAAVYVPRLAGVFCAFGMCNTDVRHDHGWAGSGTGRPADPDPASSRQAYRGVERGGGGSHARALPRGHRHRTQPGAALHRPAMAGARRRATATLDASARRDFQRRTSGCTGTSRRTARSRS